jgi:hypothetical protein
MPDQDVGRRAFLARIGLLGAVVVAGGLLTDRAGATAVPAAEPGQGQLIDALRPVLAELARDTLNGLVVMTCPGPDEYSAAQGTPRRDPGAMEAGATDFMIESLDNFVPFPDQLGVSLGEGLAGGLDGLGITLPSALAGLPLDQVITLDDALGTMLRNDETLPLSSVVAMLLNLVATQVDPAAINGAFLSPFARLSYDDKCEVFQRLEGPDADLVATLDADMDGPFAESLSGTLRFLAGALLEFAAYGSYGEQGVYDARAKTITERPVGWSLMGYQPDGVVHGWDDFLGYYQDRKQVSN